MGICENWKITDIFNLNAITTFIVTGNNLIKSLVILYVYRRNMKVYCTCCVDVKIQRFFVKVATRLLKLAC